jgi:hypothetical protein
MLEAIANGLPRQGAVLLEDAPGQPGKHRDWNDGDRQEGHQEVSRGAQPLTTGQAFGSGSDGVESSMKLSGLLHVLVSILSSAPQPLFP